MRRHFLPEQIKLGGQRLRLRIHALDLTDDLFAPLCKLLDLLFQVVAAGIKQRLLPLYHCRDIGTGFCGLDQFAWKGQRVAVVALGLQPATTGEIFEQLAFDDGELGSECGPVECQQQLTGGHGIALGDVNGGHDATVRVLDDLAVLFHLYPAGGDNRAADGGAHRPDTEAADQHRECQQADEDRFSR